MANCCFIKKIRWMGLFIGCAIIGLMSTVPLGWAQEEESLKEKIHITSDKLISGGDQSYVEFIGDVKAIQGDSEIICDTLKIYYKKDSVNPDGTPASDEQSLKKIVATGNVKIKLDNKDAETQEAVYMVDERIVILTGDNSKIISGKDSVAGSRITLYRDTGRIKVESNTEKRVEAIFFSGKQGLK